MNETAVDALEKMIVRPAKRFESQEIFELIENQQDAGARGKTDDDRAGYVPGQIAEPQKRNADLNGSHEKRQENGGLKFGLWIGERADGAQHCNGNGVRRTIDELSGGIEQSADSGHDDGGVETIFRGQTRDERVRHGLRDSNGGDGQTGDEVMSRIPSSIRA